MISKSFWRILRQHTVLFLLLPLITAGTIAYFTQNERKSYISQATLYTGIASGYSLNANKNNSFLDYSGVTNAFDNLLTTLNSKETIHQIAVSILTQHLLLDHPDSLILGEIGFKKLHEAVPEALRQSLVDGSTPAQLYAKIDSLSRATAENPIKALILRSETYYSTIQLAKKLTANRKNSSDMLDMGYETDDPGVAQQTLNYAIAVLNKRYTALRSDETSPVVNYYEGQSSQAKQRLDQAEAKLRSFNVEHEVLNYDEEMKNMAFSRETFTNEYNQELMRNRAAKAAMDAINRRMGIRGNLLAINSDLASKQAELTEVETQLINATANGQSRSTLERLQERVNQISDELKTIARRYYAAGDSPESIPQEKLVNEWLGKVLEYEESVARLGVYKKRLDEYQAKTTEYSPLGSELRELNRNLTVAEKEYLSIMDNLNQARIHRQDISIDGELKIVDAPNYPVKQQTTKRLVFIGGGIGVGLFIALLITVFRFLLDKRISSPEQAEQLIGRQVAAMFPTVKKFSIETKKSRSAISMFEQLCNALNIEIVKSPNRTHPPLITLFSLRSKQGKTWIAHGLARLYAESDQKVAYCYPRSNEAEHKFEQDGVTFLPYTIRPAFMNTMDLSHLLQQDGFNSAYYDKIILELPAFINYPIPVYLVNQSTVSLLVTDANSIWGRTEKQLLGMYNKVAIHSILIALNRVEEEYLEVPSIDDTRKVLIQPEHLIELQRDTNIPY